MKIPINTSLLRIMASATLLAGIFPLFATGKCFVKPGNTIKIIAHRGGTTERPENTLPAFKKAVEAGADILELDVRISKDGRLFILHDKTLDRTTNGTGSAGNLTLDELQQLDAGSWFDPAWEGEKIPAFREVLQWAKIEGIVLLLDLKESGRDYAEKVSREIKKFGDAEKVVVGVRSVEQAEDFRLLLPGSRQLGFITSPDEVTDFAENEVKVIRLWLHWLKAEPLLAEKVRETGKKVMINGTDGGLEETKTIIEFSPDWILTDDPAQLVKSLQKLELF